MSSRAKIRVSWLAERGRDRWCEIGGGAVVLYARVSGCRGDFSTDCCCSLAGEPGRAWGMPTGQAGTSSHAWPSELLCSPAVFALLLYRTSSWENHYSVKVM